MKHYYVYSPEDGEENGKYTGLSLAEAKTLARNSAERLKNCGAENTAALVNRRSDCVTVWSTDATQKR